MCLLDPLLQYSIVHFFECQKGHVLRVEFQCQKCQRNSGEQVHGCWEEDTL